MSKHLLNVYLVIVLMSSLTVQAQEFKLILKEHLFYPGEIVVPKNKKLKLLIENQDSTPEEFDSFDLNREKVLYPGRVSVIYIGPLSPGRYEFFGEFSPNTARGVVIVEEQDNADH